MLAFPAAATISGVLVLVGFWTPFAATSEAFVELWLVFTRTRFEGTPILLTGLSISLAMLGPGAWSLDGRLFGRKRIEIPER